MHDHPRVGVGIIVRRGEEVLLVRREGVHGSGSWSTPGGHLDYGETPEGCAAREAREETGVEVGDVTFRAVTNDLFEAEGRHYVTLWMEAEHRSGEAKVKAAHEISSVGWFRWDRLPSPLFPAFRNLLSGRCYPSDQAAG